MMNKRLQLALLASLTLGIAPFTPEPHVWGKVKWLVGGAEGMEFMDWFDLILHGAPWLWLVFEIVSHLKKRKA